jgi:hypothetical protein
VNIICGAMTINEFFRFPYSRIARFTFNSILLPPLIQLHILKTINLRLDVSVDLNWEGHRSIFSKLKNNIEERY